MSDHNVDVLIIGAGLSGVLAARALEAKGLSVTVLDKGKSVGGRLATRRVGPGRADHGAQFFTVRDPEFQKLVDEWEAEGVVFVWSQGFSDGSLMTEIQDGHPRYAAKQGLNSVVKYLAKDLRDVRTETRVVTATCDPNGWILQDEGGNIILGHALLLTAPVPQSLEILDEGATVLNRQDYEVLSQIEYMPSLTGMFWVEGKVTLPQPGAIQRRNANIAWIADNRAKGVSPDATIITVQANESYSKQMWSSPDDRVLKAMLTNLQMFMADNVVVRDAQLKRWRYATPTTTYPERCLVAENETPLVFAGDAFGGPRVEGAVLSGLAAADALLKVMA